MFEKYDQNTIAMICFQFQEPFNTDDFKKIYRGMHLDLVVLIIIVKQFSQDKFPCFKALKLKLSLITPWI